MSEYEWAHTHVMQIQNWTNETHVKTNLYETTSLVPSLVPSFALFSSQLLISSPVLPKLRSNDHPPPHLKGSSVEVLYGITFDTLSKVLVGFSFQILFPNIGFIRPLFFGLDKIAPSSQHSYPIFPKTNQPHVTHPQSIMLLLLVGFRVLGFRCVMYIG